MAHPHNRGGSFILFARRLFSNYGNMVNIKNLLGLILMKCWCVFWHFDIVIRKPHHFRILMEPFTYYRTRSTQSVLGMLGGGRRISVKRKKLHSTYFPTAALLLCQRCAVIELKYITSHHCTFCCCWVPPSRWLKKRPKS